MRSRDGRLPRPRSGQNLAAALLLLAMGLQTGCGREFYREWANQDVSEAVFEKSRDPRWRLDLFSIEPPALSRFAEPYDPDRPPAPPDDRATEALSPVSQWPDNRLLIPAEGTGYLDMLEAWQRMRPPAAENAPGTNIPMPRSNLVPFRTGEPMPPLPPASGGGSPFSGAPATPPAPNPPAGPSATNSGTPGAAMSPIPLPGQKTSGSLARANAPSQPTAARTTLATTKLKPGPADAKKDPGLTLTSFQIVDASTGTPTAPPVADPKPGKRIDLGTKLAAFQQTGLPMPVPATDPNAPAPATGPAQPPGDGLNTPPIGMDPAPNVGQDLTKPINPRPDQTPEQYRAGEAMASELAGILVPSAIDFNEAEAAGLPRNSRPYVLSMNQAFTLALINSRVYQFNLENLYISALAVTLQRFAFTPQLYAGLSPQTGVPYPGGSFPAPVPGNSFLYATRETGQQISALNLGTVAGVGKAFDTGARVLAGFANQIVFNFIGKNSIQPSVKSYLPLSIVQPFLRGGGRAVTLEPLTQAERNLLYQVRLFAKFRQEFTVTTLIGGTVTNFGSAVQSLGFTGGGNADPTVGFINVVEDVQLVENTRRNIAAYEQLVTVYRELINGEQSGLSQLQLDQVESGLQNARLGYIQQRFNYRNDIDSFKMQMGLPPDTPIVVDRSLTQRFKDVYAEVDEWQRNARRDLAELPKFAKKLPDLEDIVVDGRSVLGVYTEGANNEETLEETLLAAERVALEHRLDLMNQRATLYDAWRQLKVTANALQGVFNMTLTNQFITPPTTTNPFGFVDQSKQFSLVINAELPLVRLNERNNFRAALIGYQRARRNLQNNEDAIKNLLRQEIRNAQNTYLTYEILRKNLVLTIRQKDQAFEQIIAPPQGGGGLNTNAALQTTNLINFQNSLIQIENNLVSTWYGYQSLRLQIYRDLGTLPFDEWEAFHELFPAEPIGDGNDATPPGAGTARAPAAGPAAN